VIPRLTLLALALLACSSTPPPAAPAPSPATSPAAPAPIAAPTADEPPSARVTAVAPSKESAPGARAKIIFSNPSKRACRVLGYKLTWAGKSKAITLESLTIPPGETRERWLKVSPDDGDLAALTPESARVDVQTDCGP
jgi:hypothetical protein